MALKGFEPLTLAMISEGTFLGQVDDDLRELQRALVLYVTEHDARAAGAKAELTLKVTFAWDAKTDHFGVKATAKKTMPSRPAAVSSVFPMEDEDGTPALFARSSGSDAHPEPRQRKLATDDGRAIDPATGEVKGA